MFRATWNERWEKFYITFWMITVEGHMCGLLWPECKTYAQAIESTDEAYLLARLLNVAARTYDGPWKPICS